MVFCLILIWDLMETRKTQTTALRKPEVLARQVNLGIGFYLLVICKSATALACFLFGVMMLLLGARLTRMRNARSVILAGVLTLISIMTLNQMFGISDGILNALGRDASLTGRTDIWRVILEKDINHLVGAGFRGFWETSQGESVSLELGTNRLLTAHNGYLEVYLYGGMTAIVLLIILILTTGFNAVNKLLGGDPIGRLAIVFWPVVLIYNVTESAFFLLGPLWFTMLTVTMDSAWQNRHWQQDDFGGMCGQSTA
jgi:O-antigen ligase